MVGILHFLVLNLYQFSARSLMSIMDSITSQVRSLADNADEAERRSIQNALRELLLEFQSPMDIIYQLLNSV